MELKIYNPQENSFLQKIEWNFEDLKKEIAMSAQEYESSVYTDDTIKAAKADRAKLNKFVDALNNKRTEVRKALLKPDEQFGQEIKELTGIVQKAIDAWRWQRRAIAPVFSARNVTALAPVMSATAARTTLKLRGKSGPQAMVQTMMSRRRAPRRARHWRAT